jgi:aminopeptidase
VKVGEHVLIHAIGADTYDLARALVKEIYALQAHPYVELKDTSVTREIYFGCTEEQLRVMNDCSLYQMKQMDAISESVRRKHMNIVDVPNEKMERQTNCLIRMRGNGWTIRKWVVLRYPTSMRRPQNEQRSVRGQYFNVSIWTTVKWNAPCSR